MRIRVIGKKFLIGVINLEHTFACKSGIPRPQVP
jgi:hypothetical protein